MDSGLNEEVVNDFRSRTRRTHLHAKLHQRFPFVMTNSQKQHVVDRILDMHSFDTSSALQPEPSAICYTHAVMAAVRDKVALFHCPICMDPLVSETPDGGIDASRMWFPRLRKNHHWSSQPCDHACCRSCMKTWAETSINEQKLNIRCTAENCSYSLWNHDLQELVSREAFEHYQEHKDADYLQRLKAIAKQDQSLMRWLKIHARPCPHCHVIVSRSEGCDVMTCVCGTRFCYKCGHQSCQCRSKEIDDIWNPKV